MNVAGLVRSKRSGVPSVVGFDGVEYLVGEHVEEYATPIERMDMARFTEGPELRALLYAALFQALDGGARHVALAIGLPVEALEDDAVAAATEAGMRGWLVGAHRFTVDGKQARMEVVNIRAKIAQPICTWFDWALDEAGQWSKGREALKSSVLVIDQGFNTLDLAVLEGGKISSRYKGGRDLGMGTASRYLLAAIEKQYKVDSLGLHEADALIRSVLASGKARIYVAGALTDVTPLVRQALNTTAADVVNFCKSRVGKAGQFKILLTGGGALALAERLTAQYPHAEVVNEPVMANARGLAKLAQRSKFLVDDERRVGLRLLGLDPGFGAVKVAEVVK